jgi:predicted ATP-dependent endonuclease of OLD family
MKVTNISINNCLSFGKSGLNEDNDLSLGEFNLFVGKNNSGKSNILKALQLLELILAPVSQMARLQDLPLSQQKFITSFDDLFFAQDKERTIVFSYTLLIEKSDKELVNIIESHPEWENVNKPAMMLIRLKKDYPKTVKVNGAIVFQNNIASVRIDSIFIPNSHSSYNKYPIFDRQKSTVFVLRDDGGRKVWKVVDHLEAEQWRTEFSNIEGSIAQFLKNIYDLSIRNSFINIPPNRSITPLGDSTVEALVKLRDGTPEYIKLYDAVMDGIKNLIFESDKANLRFVYPEESGKHRMKLQLGKVQLPLSSYGSGVEQVLSLASEIMKNGSNKIVMIEEPEAHFHPSLQRKFIKFLNDIQNAFGHQYFIATHSSTFINEYERMNGKIYFVQLIKDKEEQFESTKVIPFNLENEKTLLLDLGLKPSDLRFANGILVVEGPTDQAVYADWARKIGQPLEDAGLLLIDAEGAGNIDKYLSSKVIQQTCFSLFAICDKNAEKELREKLKSIVPKENIIVLEKGDLEDYYPRNIVMDFAKILAEKRGVDAPTQIDVGKTVGILDKLKGNDGWKKQLARKIIEEMSEAQIDTELREKITQIYKSVC